MRFAVATPLRGFGGTVSSSATEPASPTIAVTNNQDGTGTVAISGSTSGATNAVKAAAYGRGDLSFSTAGSRSGDGNVAITLAAGIYVILVDSTKDSLSSRSNIVIASITASAVQSDLGEIWKALRTEMSAESALTDQLASETSIYFGPLDEAVSLPAIVLKPQDDRPIGNASFTGVWRPLLQIDILALSPYVPIAIRGALDDLFTIPQNRTTLIESATLQLTALHRTGGGQVVPTQATIEDQPVRLLPTLWNCRVAKKTT